ncbi:MAG: sulfatase-like hydrolase/transferase [bacterium]|nr:sulfatase-like hydrolase/transferase [bacterium]
MKKTQCSAVMILIAVHLCNCFSIHAQEVDRSVLPPVPAEFKGKVGETYQDSTPDFSPALPLTAPEGAPNVLVVVLDDVGYGQLGCYGGPIETPNIDKLAAGGLRYTNFHTTALCSPTRGALLTGRNHHSIGLAAITEAATGFPSNFGSIPKSAATVAEVMKQNGYNTLAFGKWHLAPYTAYTAAGPFDRWPLGMGFERFYGFIGGETDQWAPLIVRDNHMVDLDLQEGYHLTTDLVDQTIAHIRDQQQANTGRPFFAYLALGAAHAPLHAPKEFIEKYKGRFDQGWDQVRRETFERQKKMGIIAVDAVLPPANPGIQAWSELNETQRKVYCRLQEAFAGFLDHADHHLGRLFDALDAMELTDDTLIVLVSDNGASQEGLRDGTANTDRFRNYYPDTVEEMIGKLDEIGSPSTDPHYPMGWAMAGNSPLKRWKQDTHAGGNTDPFIISWPAMIKDAGGMRRQYHHIVDVVPTLLEVAHLPAPTSVNGVRQQPMPGVSMAYTFDDADAPTRKEVQYYEMLGSRAIWADGWTAVTWHKKGESWDDDQWELYHTDVDFTQGNDLAASNPNKLKELQDLWWAEAKKYNVLPLDDRRYERVADPTRPVASIEKDVYTYYPETSIVHPLAAPQLLGKPHTVTAYVTIPEDGAEGVLACFGGEFGGWSLYLKDGKLHYAHNYLKTKEFVATSNNPVPSGERTLAFRFTPTKSNLKPDYFIGDITLFVDGKLVGELKDVRSAGQYSAVTGYGLVFGENKNTSVTHQYAAPFEFTGKVDKVTIELK